MLMVAFVLSAEVTAKVSVSWEQVTVSGMPSASMFSLRSALLAVTDVPGGTLAHTGMAAPTHRRTTEDTRTEHRFHVWTQLALEDSGIVDLYRLSASACSIPRFDFA